MRPANVAELRALVGDTFTYGQARQAGIGDMLIYRLRDAGDIIALGGGVYRWADAPPADHDLIEIAERVPAATICLESALARHHLIDSIPAAIDIAIPRDSTRPKLRAPVRLHHFAPGTFSLGREPLDLGDRKQIGIYSAERSIVDVIRLRHREGSDIAWEALRNWLEVPGRRPCRSSIPALVSALPVFSGLGDYEFGCWHLYAVRTLFVPTREWSQPLCGSEPGYG